MATAPNNRQTPVPDSLIERLFHYAENTPDHDAIVTPTVTLSYAQLWQLVKAQAHIFNDAGISDKTIVGIKCGDDIQHLVLCLAATYIGATSCTIPSLETEQAQQIIINRCGVTYIADKSIAVNLPPLNNDTSNNNTSYSNTSYRNIKPITPALEAQLLFSTSGTTGKAKLVIHHDNDLVAQAHRHIASTQERFACLASMEHNFAKRHRLYCVAAGATNVYLNTDRESLVSQCQSLNVDVMHVSAFQAQELLATPDRGKLSNIRLKLGGSHVPLLLRQQLRNNITNNLQAGYGTTETGAIAFTDPNDLNAGESVGRPLPGIDIHALTPERKPLGANKRGELAVRCNGIFRGYLGEPDLTAARLEGGWFYTGDIGYLDNQQRIHLCGRSDDMFVFNSMNIYPQDIESEIRQYPDVIDAVVLPKASKVHGNIPVALVVFTKNVKQHLPALKKFVRKRVGVRSPRQYIIVDKIPTNPSGKISRQAVLELPEKSSQIRSDIIDILDSKITENLKPSLITAFKNGDTDITLHELRMDSLARMDFLISLETHYNTIITPQELAKYRYLGNIVSRILSPSPHDPSKEKTSRPASLPNSLEHKPESFILQEKSPPYVVRFFKRIFTYCHTATQLNKALSTLEHRLTPIELEHLHHWHDNGQLIPRESAEKFQTAVSYWLKETKKLMLHSGKQQPEPFSSHRIAPTAILYSGPGSTADKTLLICFTPNGHRHFMMANAVLLQHTNSERFDLLIISEPLNNGYQLGSLPFGKNLTKAIARIKKLDWINHYSSLRTFGFSSGGYVAVIAGHHLKADVAISVSGRFHPKKHLIKNLDKTITTWKAVHKGHCPRVLISHAADNSRDRKYANIITKIAGGNKFVVKFENRSIGHLILPWLLERGELATYLARTVFAEKHDELITGKQKTIVMNVPAV